MDNLGEYNLLIKQFVVGGKECDKNFTKTETTEIRALHKWIDFKDTDWGMSKYSSDRTQYIAYLEIIELNEFKGIVNDIYKNYVTQYPYSTKKDFISQVFRYTIYDLEQILEMNLIWLSEAPNENSYTYYTSFLRAQNEFVDFAINNQYKIEHYRQYYRAVLEFLKSFEKQDNKLLQAEKRPELEDTNFVVFENNFDNIQPSEVYAYFQKCLVQKEYLTEDELRDYLNAAFELETIPKTPFRLKHTPKKQSIYTIFYTYYKDIAGKPHEHQDRYVHLLGNYFEGYKSNVIRTNWSREYKAKR